MSPAERSAPGRAGFTLLEVLAAVAILGLFYTTLAGAGILGLQAEGEAERRIQASLLADQWLAGIEEALDAGTPPPIGETREDVDPFTVTTTVTAWELLVPEVELPRGLREALEAPRRPGEARRDGPALPPSFLVGERGQPSPLRRIDVVVSWTEGWGERQVVRTTFGLDHAAAQASLQAIQAVAEAAGAGGGTPGLDATGEPPAEAPAPDASRLRGPRAPR